MESYGTKIKKPKKCSRCGCKHFKLVEERWVCCVCKYATLNSQLDKPSSAVVYVDGVKYDNYGERMYHIQLMNAGLSPEFQPKYTLFEKQTKDAEIPMLQNKNASEVKVTPDFLVVHEGFNYIIDTKGYPTEMAIMRYRLLKHVLLERKEFNTRILFIYNKKEMSDFILCLKSGNLPAKELDFDFPGRLSKK